MRNLSQVKIQNGTGRMNILLSSQYGYKTYVGSVKVAASATVNLSSELSSIIHCMPSVKDGDAADVNKVAKVTWTQPSAGVLKLWGWKHTGASTTTFVAASASATVSYLAIGLKA